jgi:hypothetical protein
MTCFVLEKNNFVRKHTRIWPIRNKKWKPRWGAFLLLSEIDHFSVSQTLTESLINTQNRVFGQVDSELNFHLLHHPK